MSFCLKDLLRTTCHSSLQPENDAECFVHSAFTLLVRNREKILVSGKHLLTICRAAPDYTLKVINQNRTTLLRTQGSSQKKIAHIVRTVEWELLGTSKFIESNHYDIEDGQFIYKRLTNHPDDFAREDLHALIGYFNSADNPIQIAALNVLSNFVASFAEHIAAEPLEMSQDIESLKNSISSYGFSPDLSAILQKIDENLNKKADAFEQVATMRHIRSFFEKLHESIGAELRRCKPNVGNGTRLNQCGQAIDYLERKQVITVKFQELARCLYKILSDDDYGVHALRASRDYTRLCRNMVIEYAVVLFFEFDRRLAETGDN